MMLIVAVSPPAAKLARPAVTEAIAWMSSVPSTSVSSMMVTGQGMELPGPAFAWKVREQIAGLKSATLGAEAKAVGINVMWVSISYCNVHSNPSGTCQSVLISAVDSL